MFFVMYGIIPEHHNNSLSPQNFLQGSQRVGEAGCDFVHIPQLNSERSFGGRLLTEPQPDHRIQPESQRCCSLGAFSRPHLQLLRAKMLFGIFESIFDSPAVGVGGKHVGDFHFHVGREKIIVSFFAVQIPRDDQQHQRLADVVPKHLARINQPCDHLATSHKTYRRPFANL